MVQSPSSSPRVPFFSAQAANAGFDALASISRVLQRHWYVLGEEVKAFESAFAAWCGVAHCVGLANGTDALELALRAVGVQPGDTVLLVANAGYYGSTAVNLVGARPHYVDIDGLTLCMSPQALAKVLDTLEAQGGTQAGGRPKAIIATHLYGQLAAIEPIAQLAHRHRVPLIEDCAQSHGARVPGLQGRRAGSIGDIACFSFYPTKNLGALGDGGAIVCQDGALAERVRSLRQYGWSTKYHNDLPMGRNSRLDEIQAAVLNDKLPLLEAANVQRRAIARAYHAAFTGLPLQLPASLGEDFVAHLYVVRTPRRDALRAWLDAQGIATDIHYPVPDHLQPVARAQGMAGMEAARPGALPETEAACASVLSLPCYPGMPEADVQRVTAAVRRFFDQAQA